MENWEITPCKSAGEQVREGVRKMIAYIGDDPNREGVLETPDRVVKSWGEIFAGYKTDIAGLFKTFEVPKKPEGHSMVIVKDIEFYSNCEHHIQPFFGHATVAYIPNADNPRVVGLSKLARLVEAYARRLQIQEVLTDQIASALEEHLQPAAAACYIEATHFCMVCRGVHKQNSRTITSSLKGLFLTDPALRAEFMSIVAKR